MTIVFEISPPWQWRPQLYRRDPFYSFVWLFFAVRWLSVGWTEYHADLIVARAMRQQDEGKLSEMGANVAWVRVGDLMPTTRIVLHEDGVVDEEEVVCEITHFSNSESGKRVIHTRQVETFLDEETSK